MCCFARKINWQTKKMQKRKIWFQKALQRCKSTLSSVRGTHDIVPQTMHAKQFEKIVHIAKQIAPRYGYERIQYVCENKKC